MIDALKIYAIALSHPRVAHALFDQRPAWVWAANGEKVLWANEAGCRFFDTKSMPDLLSRGFRRIAPATHLIARIGATGALNEAEEAVLRFFRGMTPISLPSLVERIVLADGGDAVFVQSLGEDDALQTRSAAKMARRLMKLFSRGDAPTAILSADGSITEASDPFRAMMKSDTAKTALTAQAERLLAHDPFMHGHASDGASPFVMALLPHDDEERPRIFAALIQDNLPDDRTEAFEALVSAPLERERPPLQEDALTPEVDTPMDETEKTTVPEKAGSDILAADIAGAVSSDQPGAVTPAFTFKRHERPIRFLVTFDRDLVVTSLSPEFIAAVGPETGAIIGLGWPDIAERYALDREGFIARKIARQAIWSETVHWPVSKEGLDAASEIDGEETTPHARLCVPTTITAMPVFNGERAFEGFRGFGSIQTSEASLQNEENDMPAAAASTAASTAEGDPDAWERFLATTPFTEPSQSAASLSGDALEISNAVAPDEPKSDEPESGDPESDAESTLDWDMDAQEEGERSAAHRSITDQPEHLFDAETHRKPGNENKVVPLRRRPFAVRSLPEEDELASLSKPEQQAFRKIAMALSARIEGDASELLPDLDESNDPSLSDAPFATDSIADLPAPGAIIEINDDLMDFDAASIIEGRKRSLRRAPLPDKVSDTGPDTVSESSATLEADAPLAEIPVPASVSEKPGDLAGTENTEAGETDLKGAISGEEPRFKTPDERAADLFVTETPPDPSTIIAPAKTLSKSLGAGAAAILAAESAKAAGGTPERNAAGQDTSFKSATAATDGEEVAASAISAAETPLARQPETPEGHHKGATGEDDLLALREGILNRLPLGLIVSRDRQVLFVNQSALDFLGYSDEAAFRATGGVNTLFLADTEADPGSFVGRDMLKHLVIKADQQDGHIPQAVRARMADGSTMAIDLRLQSGQWQGEEALLMALSARSPEPVNIVSNEQKVSALLGQSTHIMDIASDGLLVIDAKGTLIHANSSAEALFGRNRAELRDLHFSTLFADESQKSVSDYLDSLTSNGVASVLNDGREVIGREAQGGLIPLFITIGRLDDVTNRDTSAKQAGVYCVVLRDITHWKRAEEELIESRRLAENANAQKSDFLAAISHEIRTPLNAIIGFSEVMMEQRFGPIDNPRYLEYARDINVSGNHLVSLVNDLLDLSKIEAGKLDLTFSAVALNTVIQEAVALMQPEANRDRIIIRTSLSEQLPPVVADVRSIRQIALNLLSNAVKFTKAGGQVIISTSFEENGEVAIRVRDTGIGMSETDLGYAMQPFRQIQKDQEGRKPGTGLGLPLTKALAEANRARFSIDSRVDYGTLIHVIFPNERVLAR